MSTSFKILYFRVSSLQLQMRLHNLACTCPEQQFPAKPPQCPRGLHALRRVLSASSDSSDNVGLSQSKRDTC